MSRINNFVSITPTSSNLPNISKEDLPEGEDDFSHTQTMGRNKPKLKSNANIISNPLSGQHDVPNLSHFLPEDLQASIFRKTGEKTPELAASPKQTHQQAVTPSSEEDSSRFKKHTRQRMNGSKGFPKKSSQIRKDGQRSSLPTKNGRSRTSFGQELPRTQKQKSAQRQGSEDGKSSSLDEVAENPQSKESSAASMKKTVSFSGPKKEDPAPILNILAGVDEEGGENLDPETLQATIKKLQDDLSEQSMNDSEREAQELAKSGEPMWLTNLYVDYPFQIMAVGVGVFIVFTFFCVLYETYLPSPTTWRDFFDYEDYRTQMFDAREAIIGDLQSKQNPSGQILPQSIIDSNWQLVIAFECKSHEGHCASNNSINPTSVKLLQDVDDLIEEDPIWQNVCLRNPDLGDMKACADSTEVGGTTAKASLLPILYEIYGNKDRMLDEITQFGIDFALFGLASKDDYYEYALPLFSKEFHRYSRSAEAFMMVLTLGGPVIEDGEQYSHMRDRQELQEYFVAEWQSELQTKIARIVKRDYPEMEVYVFGKSYMYRQFYRQVFFDVLWSILAVFLVFLYVSGHVKSLFVSSTALSMILISIPVTLVTYRHILKIENVSSLHLVIMFLVLGISADNIFVLWDAWTQSKSFPQFRDSYHSRMAYTFRRAYKSLLATSSTTALAFLSNGFSALMPLSAFGYFAFLIIPVNYVLMVFYFPAYIIIYEKYAKEIEHTVLKKVLPRVLYPMFQLDPEETPNPMSEMTPPKKEAKLDKDERKKMLNEFIKFRKYIRQQEKALQDEESQLEMPNYEGGDTEENESLNQPPVVQTIGNETFDDETPIEFEAPPSKSKVALKTKQQTPQDDETPQNYFSHPAQPLGNSNHGSGMMMSEELSMEIEHHRQILNELMRKKEVINQRKRAASQSRRVNQILTPDISNENSKENPLPGIEAYSTREKQPQTQKKEANETPSFKVINSKKKLTSPGGDDFTKKQPEIDLYDNTPRLGRIEWFFDTIWNDFVYKFRWIIVICGFALAGQALIQIQNITPLSEFEQYFFPDHHVSRGIEVVGTKFRQEAQGQNSVVDIMWGLEGINKTKVNFYNASDIGTPIYDTSFDLTPVQNQRDVFNFCQHLKTLDHMLMDAGTQQVDCWLDGFIGFLSRNGQSFPIQAHGGESQEDKFMHWLERYTTETQEGKDYRKQSMIGISEGRLVFMRVNAVISSMALDPYKLKKPVEEEWEETLALFNAKASSGVNRTKATTGVDWCLMIMEKKLVESQQNGTSMSLGFAMLALLVVTSNFFQAFLASLTICLIILNVMAIMVYFQWELGLSESVAVVACIGFAVDYVVHLAAHYIHSKSQSRYDRVREALRELGISILSGSVTTIFATGVLFLATLVIFNKFAIFVIGTIIFALFYSIMFFAALCHICGPVGSTGDVGQLVKRVTAFFKSVIAHFQKEEQGQQNEE